MEAVILAMAGLKRSGLLEEHKDRIRPLEVEEFIPAAGQGALAIQTVASPGAGDAARNIARQITDVPSLEALQAERAVVVGLRADCHSCLAVHVFREDGDWRGLAMAAKPDGSRLVRCQDEAPSAAEVGRILLERLLALGGEAILGG